MYKKMPVIALEEHFWDHELAAQLQGSEGTRSQEQLKRLYDIGEVRHLARRSEETGERFDRAIPDIDLMAGLAQAFRDAASDDSLTDHPH